MLGCLGAEMRLLVSYRPVGIINRHLCLCTFCRVTLDLGRGKHTRRVFVVECYEYKAADCTWRTQTMREDDSAREYHAIVGAAHLYPTRVRTPADMLHADVPPSEWPYVMRALSEWDARIPGPRLTELLPGEIVG